jgi:hypothetical protein
VADLQTIAQHLRSMAAGIDRAQHAAAMADSRAEEIAQRAMLTGFAGIAMGVQQLRGSISETRQRLTNVGRSVSEAASPVAGASGRPRDCVASSGCSLRDNRFKSWASVDQDDQSSSSFSFQASRVSEAA